MSLLGRLRSLPRALAIQLKIFLIRLQEVRTFFRFPRLIKVGSAGTGRRVLLYGIPYADWNATLSNRALWAQMADIAQVLRLPANPLGSGARADDIVIAMKTSHTKRRRGGRALEPTALAISTLEDKAKFAAYMVACGFADCCPQTYADRQEVVFPCILKRTDLSASLGVAIVRSGPHLEELLRSPTFEGRPYILQAAVAGNVEYATYCVCKVGHVLWNCTFATDIGDTVAIKREDNALRRHATVTSEAVVRQIETVLSPLAYSGPCNVDYKLSADGRMQIFEINPRLGGTLMLPAQAEQLRAAMACIIEHAS